MTTPRTPIPGTANRPGHTDDVSPASPVDAREDLTGDDTALRHDLHIALAAPGRSPGGEGLAFSADGLARVQEQALRDWAQWQRERFATPPVGAELAVSGTGAVRIGRRSSGSPGGWWRLAASGVLAVVMLGGWLWVNRPDPALEELVRLDVLSQIAAGDI
jgi:hypothetical protein